MAQKLVHKKSNQPLKAPTGATLDYGEIAVNYNVESPFLSIKNSDNTYSKFSSDDIIAAGMVEYVSGELKGYSVTGHTHDDRYYTETEVDAKIKVVNDTIEDNELTTSAAFNELNERVLGTAPAIHTHKKSDITDFEHTHGTVTLTYDGLVTLRNSSQLISGQQYRITDYVTTTSQENTTSAGHQFDVIVTADDESTLNEIARAIQHDGDTYFAENDLNAWQIWYCIDNDTNRFTWADAINGKGVIYRMIDEFGNDCAYDFKNIQFKRKLTNGILDAENGTDTWCYTFNAYNEDNSEIQDASVIAQKEAIDDDANRCYGNIINYYCATVNNNGAIMNDIVFLNLYNHDNYFSCHSNSFGNDCRSNSFGNGCHSNSFGNDCRSNSFGDGCTFNSFGKACIFNSFGNDCFYNSFGNVCRSNSFGNECNNNSFGNDCYDNSFGNYCNSNSFGNNCYDNSFGNNCGYNSFGNDYFSNLFGNNCSSNSFGNSCTDNSFGEGCHENSFGDGCYGNSFGDECYGNSFENHCYGNNFEYSCDYNSFRNDCHSNSFDTNCDKNSFGNSCYSNSFGNSCNYNYFGNNCTGNSFGAGCYENSFGNYCAYNYFGNNCDKNSFTVSASATSSLKNYVQYNHFDDGCSYNIIWNSNTTSSSVVLKNININRGVCGPIVGGGLYNFINIDTVNSEQEINVNQVDGIVSIGEVLSIKYESLKTLRDGSQLIPGRQYRIIDYVTTTTQENIQSARHPFDIIVTADSENTLNEEARTIQNIDDDGYFDDSNLSAWKLWYCLDNDTDRFAWAGDEKVSEIEHKHYDSSECTINPELIDGNVFITPFNFESCVWVDGNGDGDIGYADVTNHDEAELVYEWGYFTDENDDTHLCLYKSDAGLYEEEGQPDYGDKYLYRGVVNVNGTDYDYWQKWDNSNESIIIDDTGDYVYATTARIVTNPEAYSVTIETEEIYEPGKGVIYRMIDEWNNDCPYDFKNIQFKHPNNPDDTNWYYTFDVSSTDATVSNNVSCLLNAIKPYFVNDKVQQLNNNIFMVSVWCTGNVFQENCYSNSLGLNSSYNSFGANCYSNSLGVNCQNNSFENGCYSNNLGRISNGNSFGVNCYSNSFGANCQNNSFENGCYANNFGDDCNGNSFGDDCQDNSFENGCSSNSFGDDCQNNSFGNNCTNNSFENGCYSNSFGNGCRYNSFGIYCQGNSFGINGIGNTFGEYNMANTFGTGCDNNTFGNRCYHNSFGNACSYNSFRLNASETATLLDYCYYNHFDDSCSYNIIWNSVQPTSSNKLQNINVIRGVFGKSTAYNFINIVDKNITYEIKVAKNSSGVIKVYCEADLIA